MTDGLTFSYEYGNPSAVAAQRYRWIETIFLPEIERMRGELRSPKALAILADVENIARKMLAERCTGLTQMQLQILQDDCDKLYLCLHAAWTAEHQDKKSQKTNRIRKQAGAALEARQDDAEYRREKVGEIYDKMRAAGTPQRKIVSVVHAMFNREAAHLSEERPVRPVSRKTIENDLKNRQPFSAK